MVLVRRFSPAALLDYTQQGVRPLARRLGVDPAILCRTLSADQADRYAVAVGAHPIDVWGDDWWPWLEEDPDTDDDELTAEEWRRVEETIADLEWAEAVARAEEKAALRSGRLEDQRPHLVVVARRGELCGDVPDRAG
jgi:hypothetical protein